MLIFSCMTSAARIPLRRHSVGALAALSTIVAAANAQNAATDALKLTRGKELPVCQAYLRRLKQSHFDGSPFCGRPEDDSVAGFQRLQHQPLSEAEALPLVNRVLKFMTVGDQFQPQRTYYSKAEHPDLSHWSEDLEVPVAIAGYGSRTIIWTYNAPLDIENNGAARRVLIWQGYPAAMRGSGSCMQTRAFVLSDDGETLDEARTRAVFTSPAYVSATESPASKAADERRVIPLGDSLGILLYEGRYYIDAADLPESKKAPITYTLFLHQDGRTNKVCLIR
jgi:hypothetical protein